MSSLVWNKNGSRKSDVCVCVSPSSWVAVAVQCAYFGNKERCLYYVCIFVMPRVHLCLGATGCACRPPRLSIEAKLSPASTSLH